MKPSRERVLGLLDTKDEPAPAVARVRESAALELSVILPVRDEAANLEDCVNTLRQQSEPGFALGLQWEIIVVDDASSDSTRQIAFNMHDQVAANAENGSRFIERRSEEQSHTTSGTVLETDRPATAGFLVLDAPALESNPRLTGKSNACWAGAQRARGSRLLFTDADTLFEPGSLSRSLREAERYEAALLSYSPRQIVTGAAQQLVMPLILSELASVYPSSQVNDPAQSIAAANGQFMLVERNAYFDVGGHRALGASVTESFALARAIKRTGGRLRLRYAPEALAVRVYRTTTQMVQGWTKNLTALMPSPVALAAWRCLDFLLLFGLPLLAARIPHLVFWQRGALLLLWLRTCLRFYTRVARAHVGVVASAISPLGLPLFVALLLRSAWAYRVQHQVVWKGRSYDTNRF